MREAFTRSSVSPRVLDDDAVRKIDRADIAGDVASLPVQLTRGLATGGNLGPLAVGRRVTGVGTGGSALAAGVRNRLRGDGGIVRCERTGRSPPGRRHRAGTREAARAPNGAPEESCEETRPQAPRQDADRLRHAHVCARCATMADADERDGESP